MTIVNDTNLAYLLSLGYDIQLCKQALEQHSSLEHAVNWILDPNHPPVLNLGISTALPLTNPSVASTSFPSSSVSPRDKLEQNKKFQKMASELKKDKLLDREARQRALLDIKQDQEKRKLTKPHVTKPTTPSTTALNERQRTLLAIQKEQALDKQQRKLILQDIRNDKKEKRVKLSSPSVSSTSKPSNPPINTDEAFVQFKMLDGSTLRQKFPANTQVQALFSFVTSKDASAGDVTLICGYPRRAFTTTDGALDMREAGFLPNVSLNVVAIKPPADMEAPSSLQDQPMEEVNTTVEEEEEEADTEAVFDENEFATRFHHGMMNIRQQQATGPETSGGHRLTDTASTPMDATFTENDTDRRTHMLSAIQGRRQSVNIEPTLVSSGRKRHTKTLKHVCAASVVSFLSQHTLTANGYLEKLVYMSSDLAELLLTYLMENGQLNAFTLRKLADHCYLQNIVFDSYKYCTDSLIDDLCKSNSHMSITKLSVRGCDVITDGAIRSLEGLRNLTCLDLNNCKVTDKGLKSIENLRYISYLNLSKTKITNNGILSLTKNARFTPELQVLLLDGCTRLYSIALVFPILSVFTSLIQLSYAYIQPGSNTTGQTPHATLKKTRLELLDVNHTMITDKELIDIVGQSPCLTELKLGGCELLTTKSLSSLSRQLKNLKYIQFPNREHELDGILMRYKDFPLEHLDLTGYLNVTDEGLKAIASMKQLRSLSLDGTKMTDTGMMELKGLLELEKLSLDRTLITDTGLKSLTALHQLETLSLCRTQVRDEGLCMLGDFDQTSFARNLRTLNLSQCALVSDRGVRGISGMSNLTNLNLDHTNVTKSCTKFLQGLEQLHPVRLQGIEREKDDTLEYE